MSVNLTIAVDNSELLGAVCGPNDCNLDAISTLLSAPIKIRGNEIFLVSSDAERIVLFRTFFDRVLKLVRRDERMTTARLQSIFRDLKSGADVDIGTFRHNSPEIPGGTRRIYPESDKQATYIRQMSLHDLVFSTGSAGTGKTCTAIACRLTELLSRKKHRIVLTRPVVETGKNSDFLPGHLTQKLTPYLGLLYDAMENLVNSDLLERLRDHVPLEVAPLAYMRGAT